MGWPCTKKRAGIVQHIRGIKNTMLGASEFKRSPRSCISSTQFLILKFAFKSQMYSNSWLESKKFII